MSCPYFPDKKRRPIAGRLFLSVAQWRTIGGHDAASCPPIVRRQKMVDGKGGSLKTIHHYKTERGLMIAPPFRLFFYSIPKEKRSCFCSGPLFSFFLLSLPEHPPPVPPHSEPGKNNTRQFGRGQGVLFPPCCRVIYPPYFPLASRKPVSISMAACFLKNCQRNFGLSSPAKCLPLSIQQ